MSKMSEGSTDQLFLALRLAALEQSVAAGVGLPFLADDIFVNFDDRRAEAGFRCWPRWHAALRCYSSPTTRTSSKLRSRLSAPSYIPSPLCADAIG
jgi:hypothetical protein